MKSNTKSRDFCAQIVKLAIAFLFVFAFAGSFSIKADARQIKVIDLEANPSGTLAGSVTSDGGVKYEFEMPKAGRITFTFESTSSSSFGGVFLYLGRQEDEDNLLWHDVYTYDYSRGRLYAKESFDLTRGEFFFETVSWSSQTGSYNLKYKYEPAGESFEEKDGGVNENLATAQKISFDTRYVSHIAMNELADTFKFTVPSSGRVTLSYNMNDINLMKLQLFTAYDKQECLYWHYVSSSDATNSYSCVLTKGTYYIRFEKYSQNTGKVNFKLSFKSAKETFDETEKDNNNTVALADKIEINKNVISALGVNDDVDWFKVKIPKTGAVSLTGFSDGEYVYYELYSASNNFSTCIASGSFSKSTSTSRELTLNAGTYAIKLYTYSSGVVATIKVSQHAHVYNIEKAIVKATEKKDGTLGYFCSCGKEDKNKRTPLKAVKTIKLSKSALTYTGKKLTPAATVKDKSGKTVPARRYTITVNKTCKNVGSYKATIKFNSKIYDIKSKTFSFDVVPPKTQIENVTASKTKATVKFNKQLKGTDGYEFEYSFNKDFKKSKTVKADKNKSTVTIKISAKKNQVLYVRMRTYAKAGSKTYYSSWSEVKSGKAK